jgi:chromosome transmission fidelity protein 8
MSTETPLATDYLTSTMPSILLHPPSSSRSPTAPNPFPPLLQTPYGLALLEIQGTLHTSSSSSEVTSPPSLEHGSHTGVIGRILFPHYNPSLVDEEHPSWMKQVYLYVGRHQRLTGEVKKLGKPVAVLRKRVSMERAGEMMDIDGSRETGEELDILEVIRFKISFAGRPEPVGE